MELLSKYSLWRVAHHQVQNVPARLSQWHLPDSLGTDQCCVVCAKENMEKL